MNSIGYGETSIPSESELFLSAVSNLSLSKFVVLDIGASRGDYSLELLRGNDKIIVHAYEPSKVAVAQFKSRLNDYIQNNRCYIHNFGIGKKSGNFKLYSNFEGSGGASLNKRDANSQFQTNVKISNFESAISSIKLPIIGMKIDTEGQELEILLSAEKLLSSKHFLCVQFEFGEYTIEKKESFKQYFEFFSDLGFKMFRMSKFGASEIKMYSAKHEVHWNTNYLAIKR